MKGEGALGPDFRPDKKMREEMYDQLVAEYGKATVDALRFPWVGTECAVAEDRISLPVDPRLIKTQSADHIVNVILPLLLKHWLVKNADYGDQHREEGLGPRGEFIGLQRKIRKLRRTVWDGEPMNHEGPEEMLGDVFGTVLLMLDLYDEERS